MESGSTVPKKPGTESIDANVPQLTADGDGGAARKAAATARRMPMTTNGMVQ
jgi:hypothetical protein